MVQMIFVFGAGVIFGFFIAAFFYAEEDEWESDITEYQKGYEDGFKEGRTRRHLSEEQE